MKSATRSPSFRTAGPGGAALVLTGFALSTASISLGVASLALAAEEPPAPVQPKPSGTAVVPQGTATAAPPSSAAAPESTPPPPNEPATSTMSESAEETVPPGAPAVDTDGSDTEGSDAEGSAEQAEQQREPETRFQELPESPALAPIDRPVPGDSRTKKKRAHKLELGGRFGLIQRSLDGSEQELSLGPSFGAHVRLRLSEWLGVTFMGTIENHEVDVASEALGFEDLQATQADLRIVHLGAEVEPRLQVARPVYIGVGLGLAWNRLEAGGLEVEEPIPFDLQPRSGVLLEATASPRVLVKFSPRFGASWWGTIGLPLVQSGDVFASGEGDLQTVRTDTGELISVGGFDEFSLALSTHLSFDVFF